MDSLNNSFSDEESLADMNAVMVDISYMQDDCNPIKKLSDTFEGCVKDDSSLKVYLRVRPVPNKQETTITVDSDTTIVTHAPDNSKRAAYTKLETRHYVRVILYILEYSCYFKHIAFALYASCRCSPRCLARTPPRMRSSTSLQLRSCSAS